LHDQGQLAFVWQKKLYLFHGNNGALRALFVGSEVVRPKWLPEAHACPLNSIVYLKY